MILIADSGSTKTTWCFISTENKTTFFSTSGINPYFRTTKDIVDELKAELVPKISGPVQRVYFYGAGIVNDEIGSGVGLAIAECFQGAAVETHSDLLAAARATLKGNKGIACIMGTGSNSCLYDGEKIVEQVPPLGFILGDEGSGAVLGKKLLADVLKGIIPENLAKKFRQKFSYQYADYLQKVYKQERANTFLASLVPFISENINEEYCRELLSTSFVEFAVRNILQYTNSRSQPVCFVGSVAFYFKEVLHEVLEKKGLTMGIVLKEPMEGLIEFHSKK